MRLIRRKEMLHMTGLTKTGHYHLEKQGSFPARKMLTKKLCAWELEAVERWIKDRPTAVMDGTPCITIGGKPGRKHKIKEEINVTGGEL